MSIGVWPACGGDAEAGIGISGTTDGPPVSQVVILMSAKAGAATGAGAVEAAAKAGGRGISAGAGAAAVATRRAAARRAWGALTPAWRTLCAAGRGRLADLTAAGRRFGVGVAAGATRTMCRRPAASGGTWLDMAMATRLKWVSQAACAAGAASPKPARVTSPSRSTPPMSGI